MKVKTVKPLVLASLASGFFLLSCAQPEAKPTFGSSSKKDAYSGDKSGSANSEKNSGTKSANSGGTTVSSLGQTLKLTAAPDSDAVDYTFGVMAVEFDPGLSEVSFKQSRALVTDGTLTQAQLDSLSPICRDIGLSSDASSYVEASDWKKGQKLYLMWRSHYRAAAKQALADLIAQGNAGAECLLHLNYQDASGAAQNVNLVLDPAPASATGFAGSAKLDQAVKAGLLLPQIANSTATFPTNKLNTISDALKVALKVAPLSADKLPINAHNPTGEQCYYATGTTRVANPYGMTTMTFDVGGDSDPTPSDIKAKTISGRMIAQCQNLKPALNGKSISMDVSCDDYQKIKEQGMEAGCAWDVTVANPQDNENSVALPMQMSKLVYKSIDSSKVDQALQLVPQSPENPIRNKTVTLKGMSQGQTLALSDMFDLWIALDADSFRRDFASMVRNIQFGTNQKCGNSGGYTYYNTDTINWCPNGDSSEASVAQRFKDPVAALYRSVLFYHEARHAHDIRHDYEPTDYAACQGTAMSASLAYIVGTKCDYDYCKAFKSAIVSDYKLEMDYDFNGDGTGRKGQGLCRTWSAALGISGNGY